MKTMKGGTSGWDWEALGAEPDAHSGFFNPFLCLSSAGCPVTRAPLPRVPPVCPPPMCPAPSVCPTLFVCLACPVCPVPRDATEAPQCWWMDPAGTRAGQLVPLQVEPDLGSVTTKRVGPARETEQCQVGRLSASCSDTAGGALAPIS